MLQIREIYHDRRGGGVTTIWYNELDRGGRRTFWACFSGYALDAMDVQLYSFAMPALIALWHISSGEAGLLASATLVFSAIGGWGAGILADRYGRVRILQVTIVWFAFFTFLSGFTTSYEQLFVTRSLQGLGFGGEWATGSVLLGETIAARRRGLVVGIMQSGWAVGWGMAALFATLFFTFFDDEFAWRLLFVVGVLPALLALFVRRLVPESEAYRRSRSSAPRHRPLAIFAREHVGTTTKGCLLALGIHGGYYSIATWLPTYLRTERQLSVLTTGSYLAVIIIGSLIGYWCSAFLNDRWGRRPTFLLYAVGCLGIAIGYTLLPITNAQMLVLGFPLGFFASGIYSGLGPLFTELYPTAIRGSGQGFCFNFGRGIAALFPALVGLMSAELGLAASVGVFAGIAYGLVIAVVLVLPETKGRELDAPAAAANVI